MAARNLIPRCMTIFNQIPIESLMNCNHNAMLLGKKFLTAIFDVMVYWKIVDICRDFVDFKISKNFSNSEISECKNNTKNALLQTSFVLSILNFPVSCFEHNNDPEHMRNITLKQD